MARKKPMPEHTIKSLFAKSRIVCAFKEWRLMIASNNPLLATLIPEIPG